MATDKMQLIPKTSGRKAGFRAKAEYYDYSLVAIIVLLICFGLIMLYSTSSYLAEVNYGDDMFYLKKQGAISLVCLAGALWVSRYDYRVLAFFVKPLYIVSVILMVLVKTPLGYESHGARRWLKIGPIQFQPAEIAKIAVIVTLSYMIVVMGRRVKTLKSCMIMAATGGFQALIAYVFTDNLSTALIIFGITVCMIFLAHPKIVPFVVLLILGILLVIALVYAISKTDGQGNGFRFTRIYVWLHPEKYSDDETYQTMQSLYAIGSGGFLGRGLGNSIQKIGSIPEAQNDFIFSIICEELGVLGALIVVSLFAYLLYRLFFIAQNATDMFGELIASGIFVHIALQVVLNIAVVTNSIPNTGVTLPFISYGGTSILFLMAEMGLALSISRQIRLNQPQQLL
jgi:cell division protein FtsW